MARTVTKINISVPNQTIKLVTALAARKNMSLSKTFSSLVELMLEIAQEANDDMLLTEEQKAQLARTLAGVLPTANNVGILPSIITVATGDTELAEIVKAMPIPARVSLLI